MTQQRMVELQSLCSRVTSGGTPLRTSPEYFDGGTIPWIKTGEVKQGFIHSAAEHITELGLENSSAKLIPANSLIVAMYGDGDTAGNVAVNRIPVTTNQACCNFVVDEQKAHYLFLYYYLKANYQNLVNLKLGGSQQNLNASTLKRFPVPDIEFAVQQKIAALLYAYDDLIANNQRRIALLESMAEEIYREWFVRLRFPGARNALATHGVPRGWRPGSLSELAVECGVPTTAGRHLEGRLYCPLDALASRRMIPETHYEWDQAQSSLITFNKGEILFGAMRPYQHKVSIAPFDGVTRTTTFVLRPRQPEYYSYLFLTLFQASSVDFASQICNGSDRPYAVWNRGFERLPVWIPDVELAQRFNELVQPMLDSLMGSYFLLRSLTKQRDALLPRLIAGKLRVDHLDIQFPPSMQPPVEAALAEAIT